MSNMIASLAQYHLLGRTGLRVTAGARHHDPGRLTRLRHHGREQDQQSDRQACARQRGGEPAERVRHQHQVAPRSDRSDDWLDVLLEPGGIVDRLLP